MGAPEFLGPQGDDRKPEPSSDMWRAGCTLFVMLLRRPPFAADGHTEIGKQSRLSNVFYKTLEFKSLSADAQDLISNLLVGDPANRLTAEQALEHPWLRTA